MDYEFIPFWRSFKCNGFQAKLHCSVVLNNSSHRVFPVSFAQCSLGMNMIHKVVRTIASSSRHRHSKFMNEYAYSLPGYRSMKFPSSSLLSMATTSLEEEYSGSFSRSAPLVEMFRFSLCCCETVFSLPWRLGTFLIPSYLQVYSFACTWLLIWMNSICMRHSCYYTITELQILFTPYVNIINGLPRGEVRNGLIFSRLTFWATERGDVL